MNLNPSLILLMFSSARWRCEIFLCELYFHNFFLKDERDGNPNHFKRDVHFQSFIPFTKNQIKWDKAYIVFQKRENRLDLWVSREATSPLQTVIQHERFMEQEVVLSSLSPIHRDIIKPSLDYIEKIREEAL